MTNFFMSGIFNTTIVKFPQALQGSTRPDRTLKDFIEISLLFLDHGKTPCKEEKACWLFHKDSNKNYILHLTFLNRY